MVGTMVGKSVKSGVHLIDAMVIFPAQTLKPLLKLIEHIAERKDPVATALPRLRSAAFVMVAGVPY